MTKNLIEDTAKAGEFVASARLTANFGDAATEDKLGSNMIKGSVSNFRENGFSLGDWTVTLKAAMISSDDEFTAKTDAMLGSASKVDGGDWTGRFFGNSTQAGRTAADEADATDAQKQPYIQPVVAVHIQRHTLTRQTLKARIGATKQ